MLGPYSDSYTYRTSMTEALPTAIAAFFRNTDLSVFNDWRIDFQRHDDIQMITEG